MKRVISIWMVTSVLLMGSCKEDPEPQPPEPKGPFYFGADLSYVNQILDYNGVYKDEGEVRTPYRILSDHGANLARFRLWHNPAWTKDIYGAGGTQMYNDIKDVEKSIGLARAQGLEILLDFHYSDNWADPGNQEIPAAWLNITDINVLGDSVYNYTYKTLNYLKSKDLQPDLVQIGNETNCGMLYTDAPTGFPSCNVCTGSWSRMGLVLNRAIEAIRDVSEGSSIDTKVVLHVADPKNVEWWFDNMKTQANVTDFDVVGFSYYPLWHTTVSLSNISNQVQYFKNRYDKEVVILETAYPWTTAADDSYTNLFGSQTPLVGYPFTVKGQGDFMIRLSQEVMDGGGRGVVYWEPAWITSDMKDQWGTGSAWENATFFDFDGNTIESIDFMTHEY